jgi:protein-S-isoprenylcysteine O-methyltransferase Ste14
MHAVLIVMGVGWLVFWIGWLIAAFTAKSSRGPWGRLAGLRAALILVVIFLLRGHWGGGWHYALPGPALAVAGLVLWAAGLGLAVWARLYIGRNWGMPMTKREQPDLVTTGPYRFIRHPIYSGIILGAVGTALATTLFGLIAVAVIAGFFVFSASREERFLAAEFPDAYPPYKARTKMLVPFVF